jgi:hypothetical protein
MIRNGHYLTTVILPLILFLPLTLLHLLIETTLPLRRALSRLPCRSRKNGFHLPISFEVHGMQHPATLPFLVFINKAEYALQCSRKLALDIYVKDFVSAKSRAKRFPGQDKTAKISIRFTDIADAVKRSWDSYEKKKRELTRKADYEKQEYFPPSLAASNPTKSVLLWHTLLLDAHISIRKPSRLLPMKSYNGNRSFSTLPTSNTVSAICEPQIFVPRSLALPIMSKYKPPRGLGARASASSTPILPNIRRRVPWVLRLLR